MTNMKAVRIHEYGGPNVLSYEDAPLPEPGANDVLVAVHSAAVNPVDWKVREGYLRERIDYPLPFIPGWDVSGVVVRVGAAVTRLRVDDEVYGRPDLGRDGCYAEYVAIREQELAPKPRTLNHLQAAAVPLAGLTAWQALFEAPEPYTGAKLGPEQRILIHGAAGGVGSLAVQLARWRGAYVIGTGSAHSADFLMELGVHEFVNYEVQRFEQVVRDVDVVFDTIGGRTQELSWQTLRPGGTLVSIIQPPSPEVAREHDARAAYVFVQPNADQLLRLRELIEKRALRPVVSEVLPLSEAATAHEHIQTGHTHGKIVLSVCD